MCETSPACGLALLNLWADPRIRPHPRTRILASLLVRGWLLRRWYLGLGEMAKLPQAVVFRQSWFGCERGPVDEAAQREAGTVEPVALSEVGHIE